VNDPYPLACTVFVFAAFVLAGAAQTAWLKSGRGARWQVPLDGYRRFRGRRIFGDNKTWNGFIVMVPATGIAFLVTSAVMANWFSCQIWSISPLGYLLLGGWAGFWFMAGELPNSFMKRQFGILPGQPAPRGWKRNLCFVLDQIDSVVAGIASLVVWVKVPALTWILVLGLGGVVHWLFNVALLVLGVKARAA
jgi:hypothetical protein